MSSFSPDWLALRESADHRARNATLADALKTRFLQRDVITVIDLGCGTGSNLRATAPLLPDRQHWTLVDHDPVLLASARRELTIWAEACEESADQLVLRKASAIITVAFRQADLTSDLDRVLNGPGAPVDLVTASALFDLASDAFIKRFAASVATHRAVFYTVLTYNGIQRWSPRGPTDQRMLSAFCQHQMTDKGFGVSAGPTAAIELAEAFVAHGYTVQEGDSPWRLTVSDAKLMAELAIGFAAAVRQTKALPDAEIDSWIARRLTGAEVGHTDTLAMPGSSASNMTMGVEEDD
jgi:SAM-dependent methyltransferase